MAKVDLKGALKVLAAAMRGGASEEAKPVDIVALGKELVANESLTAKQYEQITAMDDEQKGMVSVLLEAMLTKAKREAADDEEPPPMEDTAEQKAAKAAAAAAAPITAANKDKGDDKLADKLESFLTTMNAKVDGLVAEVASLKTNQGKAITDTMKRNDLIARLVANEASPFSVADLEAMTTDVLAKLESKLRPADYSGQGQFASNMAEGGSSEGADAPLVANAASFLLKKRDKKDPKGGKDGERAAA